MCSPVNNPRPEIGEYWTLTAGCNQHSPPGAVARRAWILLVPTPLL